jgi:hypothetical protein
MHTLQATVVQCSNCGFVLDDGAKFCGGCGNMAAPRTPVMQAPKFATVQPVQPPKVAAELEAEAAKLYMQLARERVLLLFHWGLFFAMNFVGLWLSLKCYHEFHGDEMSKIMIASTPFLFINTLALMCLVTIKGTRKEIANIKERISFVKFKIEFGHLMR